MEFKGEMRQVPRVPRRGLELMSFWLIVFDGAGQHEEIMFSIAIRDQSLHVPQTLSFSSTASLPTSRKLSQSL